MTLSRIGRISRALVASMAVVLGMSACGGYTVGFMWVLGTQYNQIAGFKIDDFTGNLTTIPHSPFPSGGTNPVSLVVKPGGRYLYVINKGTAITPERIEASLELRVKRLRTFARSTSAGVENRPGLVRGSEFSRAPRACAGRAIRCCAIPNQVNG